MPQGIRTIDVFNDALYVTSASYYADGSQVGGSGADSRGEPMGTNWEFIFNSTDTAFYFKAIHQTEIDLTGLDHAVIAPVALATYQCEAPGVIGKNGSAYYRDFTWITTRPLDANTMLGEVDSFSPIAPYQRFANLADTTSGGLKPALIAKEQLFLGRASLWAHDSSLDELLGFMRPLWGQDWNLGNDASTRKLYYTRVIYGTGNKSSGAVNAFWCDIPARHDQIAYAEIPSDENTEAMTMIRSYQNPQGPE